MSFRKLFKINSLFVLMKKERVISYVFLVLVLGSALWFLFFLRGSFTGFAVYVQSTQSDFDEGAYSNTEWNGSAVVLSSGQTEGSYTSKIFDAGSDATWNSLNMAGGEPILKLLFGVDRGGGVFKSTDSGESWEELTDNYGRTTYTNDMISDNIYLYILTGTPKEIWRSSNGISWGVINDTFSTYSLLLGGVDSQGYLYVANGPGELWKSTDSGVSWTFLSDFNPTTYDPKGLTIDSEDNIFVVDGLGDVYESTDSGENWNLINDYGGGTATDDMKSDSLDNLYILLDKTIYKSTDSGVNWEIINDSFTSYSNNGVKMLIDSEDNMFILDLLGRVFKSTDFGVSWNEISDMNGVANNDPYGLVESLQNTNLTFQVRNCSQQDCSDGTWKSADLDNITLAGRYFQYKINFSTPDSSITPGLESVSIDYDLINQPPVILIAEPQARLYTSGNLNLDYSATDSDGNLDSCWYTLDSGVTNTTLANCSNSTLSLSDGSYDLIIYANDSWGLESGKSVSFDIDATGVSVSLTEPTGTKTSRAGISLVYNVIGDNLTCWYNVKTSIGGGVIGNTTLVNCSSSTFSVSSDGDYVLNIFVNNSFGNSDSDNSSFTVDTTPTESGGDSTGGGSSSGGGGGGSSGGAVVSSPVIQVGELATLIMKSGEAKDLSVNVKNKGVFFLDDCFVKGTGNYSDWVSSSEKKGLAGGESYGFLVNIKVPQNIASDDYSLQLKVACGNSEKTVNFGIEIIEEKVGFNLIDVKRTSDEEVNVTYSLKELSGEDQNIDLQFLLFDSDNNELAETKETHSVFANSENQFETLIPIDSSYNGDAILLINLNSATYSTFVQEDIVLGSVATGFAILGDSVRMDNLLTGLLILVFLAFAIFVVRRILTYHKKLRIKK